MSLSVQNDLATITQYDGKVVLMPKDGLRIGEFDKYDLTMLLALYTSCVRLKLRPRREIDG